jgi:hypothetical protein
MRACTIQNILKKEVPISIDWSATGFDQNLVGFRAEDVFVLFNSNSFVSAIAARKIILNPCPADGPLVSFFSYRVPSSYQRVLLNKFSFE